MKFKKKVIEYLLIAICGFGLLCGFIIMFLYLNKNEQGLIKINDLFLVPASEKISELKITENDLLLIKKQNLENYHINNIIAYNTTDESGNIITKAGTIVDGYTNDNKTSYIFMVKTNKKETTISGEDIVGKWEYNKINNGAIIVNKVVSRIGFITITIIPFLLLYIYQFIFLIIDYLNINKFSYKNL